MAPGTPSFFAELRRRHVWRAAIAYAVAGWLLVQVATQVFPFFDIPNWAVRLVVILIVIGFPVAVVLAWAFEITPEGIRRTESSQSPDARTARETSAIGRRLDIAVIAVLALAVTVMGWRLLAPVRAPESPVGGTGIAETLQAPRASADARTQAVAAPPADAPVTPPKSIAVLPFENLSDDRKNDYFVAGMQDLILTKLADIGDLKVISRTSTAKYASRPDDLKTIGRQLGVATILEGSVQKAGEQVLVNVQLVDTANDSHLWAQSYQRKLDDIFGVEGEIAGQIATALHAKLSPAESGNVAAVPTHNQAAYDLFLRAVYEDNKGNVNSDLGSMKAAVALYRQAVEADPQFALAWALLSYSESALAFIGGGGENVKQLHRQARADAERAVRLQPRLAAAQRAVGYSEYYGREDYAAALAAFAAALRLNPNDVDAFRARAFVLRRQGRFDDALASMRQSLALDPRNSEVMYELGSMYLAAGRYAEAEDASHRALALDPDNRSARIQLSTAILLETGDVPRALAAAQGDDPISKLQRVALLTVEREFRGALALLDGVPDTPDNFAVGINYPVITGGPKPLLRANLYRLMGDTVRARAVYAEALPLARAQVEMLQGIYLAFASLSVADAQIGIGRIDSGLDAITAARGMPSATNDRYEGPIVTLRGAQLYVRARRADLAIPLLAKALAPPGVGSTYSPVMLWLDPAWDPIRRDPRFEALLQQYAKYKPVVTYDAPAAGTGDSHE